MKVSVFLEDSDDAIYLLGLDEAALADFIGDVAYHHTVPELQSTLLNRVTDSVCLWIRGHRTGCARLLDNPMQLHAMIKEWLRDTYDWPDNQGLEALVYAFLKSKTFLESELAYPTTEVNTQDKTKKPKKRCKNCKYWDLKGSEENGSCLWFYVGFSDGRRGYPYTGPDFGCHAFKPRE